MEINAVCIDFTEIFQNEYPENYSCKRLTQWVIIIRCNTLLLPIKQDFNLLNKKATI